MTTSVPNKFPFLCQAIYSWSGEEEGDLGFIEGDLIECIGLGDGQWWVGRLKRNKAVGHFPSNYVTIIEQKPITNKPKGIVARRALKDEFRRPASALELRQTNRIEPATRYYPGDQSSVYTFAEHNMKPYEDIRNDPQSDAEVDSAPPMPPPHKVLYRPHSSMSIREANRILDIKRPRTPTPLRHAMEDVMEGLENISTPDQSKNKNSVIENKIKRSQESEAIKRVHARPVTHMDTRRTYNDEDDTQEPLWRRRSTFGPRVPSLTRPKSSLGISYPKGFRDQEDYDDDISNTTSTLVPLQPISNISSQRSLLRLRSSLSRSGTVKTASTASNGTSNLSNSTAATTSSNLSVTSAGSLARRKAAASAGVAASRLVMRDVDDIGTGEPVELPTATRTGRQYVQQKSSLMDLKLKRSTLFNKIKSLGSGSSAKSVSSSTTSKSSPAAISSSYISSDGYRPGSAASGIFSRKEGLRRNASQEQSTLWIQARTDVNRAISMSQNERDTRKRRQELEGFSVSNPLDIVYRQVKGDEGIDGMPVEGGMDVSKFNFSLLDRNVRSTTVPSLATLPSFTTTVLCRPYKSDIQRLRAIFIFCSENIIWQPSSLPDETIEMQYYDTNRIFRSKKASADELAFCFKSMCDMLRIPCEVIKGYLKVPGERFDGHIIKVNHAWNAVVVDGEWRLVDASLASPTHPKRTLYTNCPENKAEDFYFLSKPLELISTHISRHRTQQHIVPTLPHRVLYELPSICPGMIRNNVYLSEFDTSLLRTSGSEVIQIDVQVPWDIDCIAELEVRGYIADADGDIMESGEVCKIPALTQPYWSRGARFFRAKAVLPENEQTGVLKIYAGNRGLVHSIKDNPYPLAIAFPVTHSGAGMNFSFVQRHPCSQAMRYDLYIVQPQCKNLVYNNTFLFDIKQFLIGIESITLTPSKSAKLAVQGPSGKIFRMTLKDSDDDSCSEAQTEWETLVKCNERGTWRGLVMADRSSSWCVFAEWTCK
ncbi:hypothetical protein V1511DRAFT_358554 [Dipodascopsis uninucleata]